MASIIASGITSFIDSVSAATKRFGGNQVTWISMQKAKGKAKRDGKPIMLIIYKEDCSSCENLSSWLAYNPEAKEACKGLIMVSCDYRDAPQGYDKGFDNAQQGMRFFPRTLFFTPDGKPLPGIGRNLKFKYSYQKEEDILHNMQKVKDMHKEVMSS